MMKKKKMTKTNKQIVFEYLDSFGHFINYPFYGRHLQELIFSCTDRNPYIETVLKYTREYCSITGAKLICLSKQKSKYYFIPGNKILSADPSEDTTDYHDSDFPCGY